MRLRFKILATFSLFLMVLPVLAVQGFTTSSEVITRVFVSPEEVTVGVNETFQVSVDVAMVSRLQGFDFMLSYDTNVLDCLDVQEGDFLSASGITFVVKRDIDDDFSCCLGRVWFVVVVLETGYSDGNGTLATITFKAICTGETALNLYSDSPLRQDAVKFTTCSSEVIANVAVDGYVTVVEATSHNPLPDPPPSISSSDPPGCDVNSDGVLDMKDLTFVAVAYGTIKGQLKYNDRADVDQNEMVNIVDVVLVAKQIYL